MSRRKAAVLAVNLPPGARIWAALGSDNAWTAETHMLANAVDTLVGANWQRSGGDGAKPTPVPRPGDEARAKVRKARMSSRAEQYKTRQQDRDGDS